LPLHGAFVAGVQRELAQALRVRELLGRRVRNRFIRLHAAAIVPESRRARAFARTTSEGDPSMADRMLDLMLKLDAARGISGYEEAVAEIMHAELAPLSDEQTSDPLG